MFGEMDPYIIIDVDGKLYSTHVCEGSGKNPVWNTKIKIPIASVYSQMNIKVIDKDLTTDDVIGEKKLNLFKEGFLYPSKKLVSHPVYIFYREKAVGKINLQSRFNLNEEII